MKLKALVVVMSVFAIQAQAETLNYKGKGNFPDAEGNSVCRVEIEADQNMNPIRVALKGYFSQNNHPDLLGFIVSGKRFTSGIAWDGTRTHRKADTEGVACSFGQDNCFEVVEEGNSFLFKEKYRGGAGQDIRRDLTLRLTLIDGQPLVVSASEQIETKGLLFHSNVIQNLTCTDLVLTPTEE